MPTAPLFLTASDGTCLAYLDQGAADGSPVLCLAGLTRSKEDFDPALPALAGCRILRMDYRGRGESDHAPHDSYTIAQEARDALALLDHLGLARVAILGTSRGGLIGMHLAGVARHRLTGLCLVDIGPQIAPDGLARIREQIGRRPRVTTLAEMAAALPRANPGFTGVSPAQWQAMAARLYRQGPEGLTLTYDPALRQAFLADYATPQDQWADWRATAGMPVALIRGAQSDLLTHDIVARMRDIRPQMLFTEVDGRGHVPFLDEPQAVALLRDWIKELP